LSLPPACSAWTKRANTNNSQAAVLKMQGCIAMPLLVVGLWLLTFDI
jgi:hypothetical protein